MSNVEYEIRVCPLCGEQVEVEVDDFFGDGHCRSHGKVAPMPVKVAPVGPTTATRAWLVKNGLRVRWEFEDPQRYGHSAAVKVLTEYPG